MKKIFVITLVVIALFGVSASVVMADTPATGGLVKCGKTDESGNPAATQCGFADLIALINTIIQYLIFIAMPLAAVSFAYAGWIYLSAGGDTGKVKKAHDIFLSVGIGFILILSAWLIFKWIGDTFLSDIYKGGTYLN